MYAQEEGKSRWLDRISHYLSMTLTIEKGSMLTSDLYSLVKLEREWLIIL